MKFIFCALMTMSSITMASSTLVVKDFNFDYQDSLGKGSASEFTYAGFKNSDAVTVEVEKILKSFKFKVQGALDAEYVFNDAPDLLIKAQEINLKAFNLTFIDKLLVSLTDA